MHNKGAYTLFSTRLCPEVASHLVELKELRSRNERVEPTVNEIPGNGLLGIVGFLAERCLIKTVSYLFFLGDAFKYRSAFWRTQDEHHHSSFAPLFMGSCIKFCGPGGK